METQIIVDSLEHYARIEDFGDMGDDFYATHPQSLEEELELRQNEMQAAAMVYVEAVQAEAKVLQKIVLFDDPSNFLPWRVNCAEHAKAKAYRQYAKAAYDHAVAVFDAAGEAVANKQRDLDEKFRTEDELGIL